LSPSAAPTPVEIAATVLFAVAILHTFSTKFFERLAHRRPAHAGLWHLLGEVEIVFGFWAMVLVLLMVALNGTEAATEYLDNRNFTEPMFVFVIMVVAGSRPILHAASVTVRSIARLLVGVPRSRAFYFATLSVVPLLGSFITEPAAMTLAALILRDHFYARGIPSRLKYATLGVLFVNVSIGGTLTPYAAPPVLMVAGTWGWDLMFMLTTFGWRAALAVFTNALLVTLIFWRALPNEPGDAAHGTQSPPPLVTAIHLAFLIGIVTFAHHPSVFMGMFLFFLGFATAYEQHQNRLILREGLLVAFFLGGLVVLGALQQWWLKPLLTGMSSTTVYFGATLLTAVTDNAALTYLGSLVEGLSDEFKYALVAGAVTGGGLTVIANAPNPAGFSILRESFDDGAIQPVGLLVAALPPTLLTIVAFMAL
jgi:hypothetical protein